MQTLDIFVPASPSALPNILPGSAIVGVYASPSVTKTLIHFEGNRFNAFNMTTLEGRLQSAADRYVERYPTIAKTMVENTKLLRVATASEIADTKTWVVRNILDTVAFAKWLGDEPLPRIDGSAELRSRLVSRAYPKLPLITVSRLIEKAQIQKRNLTDVIFEAVYRSK